MGSSRLKIERACGLLIFEGSNRRKIARVEVLCRRGAADPESVKRRVSQSVFGFAAHYAQRFRFGGPNNSKTTLPRTQGGLSMVLSLTGFLKWESDARPYARALSC